MPNQPAPPTVRRRRLGTVLRRMRHDAGMTLEEAAGALGWKAPKMSKIENAAVGLRPADVSAVLAVYGVTAPETVDPLVALARDSGRRGWWQTYVGAMKPAYAEYIELESDARRVQEWSTCVIPGLLQTAGYAREVFASASVPPMSPERIDAMVEIRQARQAALSRPGRPLDLWVVIHEAVLRNRVVGRPHVMRDQLRRLREATDLPGVTLQVMSSDAPPHPGLNGPFLVFQFDSPLPDVVIMESVLGNAYLEDPAVTDRFVSAFERIIATAMSPNESVEFIRRLEEEQG